MLVLVTPVQFYKALSLPFTPGMSLWAAERMLQAEFPCPLQGTTSGTTSGLGSFALPNLTKSRMIFPSLCCFQAEQCPHLREQFMWEYPQIRHYWCPQPISLAAGSRLCPVFFITDPRAVLGPFSPSCSNRKRLSTVNSQVQFCCIQSPINLIYSPLCCSVPPFIPSL